MPNDLIKKIAREKGISVHSVENKWNKAIDQAKKENATNIYPYATSIVEKETHYKSKKDKK